jgi:hypothetical protein
MSTLSLAAVSAQNASAATRPRCTDSWKARAGGAWSTGADWSKGSAPTAGDAACITVPLKAPVVLNGSAAVGSLTLGGANGPDELMFDGGTLSVGSTSAVARTGEVASTGYGGIVKVATGAVLSNQGTVKVGANLQLSGDVTNASGGLVSVDTLLYVDTGKFTNLGEVLVHTNAAIAAPYNGGTGAVIDNAGGKVEDLGSVTVNKGATFVEGSGSLTGASPSIAGALDLVGAGASEFDLSGYGISPTVSGDVAADQSLLVHGSTNDPVEATGSFTNAGTIFGFGCLKLPPGGTVTNAGLIVVPPGTNFYVAANVENQPAGTIAMDGNSPYGAILTLYGAVTLANEGTINVGSLNSSLSAGTAGTISNQAGTISNGGTVTVPGGARFVEGAGTTSGSPVIVYGALRLAGTGASSFETEPAGALTGARISGDIARAQTVWVDGGSISPTSSSGSFTNYGTLIGNGYLKLPAGATLTNQGVLEVGHGGLGSAGLSLDGNLVNTPGGVIGENEAGIDMAAKDTSFDNAGTLDMLFEDNYDLAADNPQSPYPRDITFRNTGTIYLGVGGDVAWGGFGLASAIWGYTGDTVDIGGTIIPVPTVEPKEGPAPGDTKLTYGITTGTVIPGTKKPVWTLSCSAKVLEGWSLSCGSVATLTEDKATTLVPTTVSVTGSGTANGSSGWETSYGQPVTFTATVSAQNGSVPTGKVAFFGAVGLPAGATPAIHPDLLGTASLSTKDGLTTARLTTSSLPPGLYQLLALYYGDASHLAASTMYGSPGGQTYGDQTVTQEKTTITLSSSRETSVFGAPVTLSAKVVPAGVGPANPGGVVTFFDGGTPIGTASVSTDKGVTTAQVATADLPVGSDSITAGYSGDYDYAGGTSPALVETETAP